MGKDDQKRRPRSSLSFKFWPFRITATGTPGIIGVIIILITVLSWMSAPWLP